MLVDQERAARLKQARIEAGYRTAVEGHAATASAGVGLSAYRSHENGTRGFTVSEALTYARIYRVEYDWLQFDRGPMRRHTSAQPRVAGVIGQFGIVMAAGQETAMPQEILQDIEIPPGGGDFDVFKVDGEYNFPALFAGDVVYASKPMAPELCIGKQCIVTTKGGSRRIAILARGTAAGLYLLMSFNATPIPDVEIMDAAPIIWIRRG